MKKISTLALVLFLLSATANAQAPFSRLCEVDTTSYFGVYFGLCSKVQQMADGGYLTYDLRGQMGSEGLHYFNGHIIRTDATFKPLWHTYGSYPVVLGDNTIGQFGNVADSSGGATFMKMDGNGNLLMAKSYRNTLWVSPSNASVRINGGMRMLSFGDSHPPTMLDVDSIGNLLSSDTIYIAGVAPQDIYPYYMASDNAGNCIITATEGMNPHAAFFAKLLPDRTPAWTVKISATVSQLISRYSTLILPGGDVLIANSIREYGDSMRILLIKLSPTGNLVWQKIASAPSGITDMTLLPNGHVLLVNGASANDNGWVSGGGKGITEIDTAANVIWNKRMATPVNGNNYAAMGAPCIKSATEWYFSATTYMPYQVALFSTDNTGTSSCPQVSVPMAFSDTSMVTFTPYTMSIGHMPMVTVTNTLPAAPSLPQHYIDGCLYDDIYVAPATITNTRPQATPIIYPNPATDKLHVTLPKSSSSISTLTIYDMAGRQCLQQPNIASTTDLDISMLPQATYIIRITSNENTPYYTKLVVAH